jgi:hypothetical protein
MTLYVVERWLARLSASPYADQFVIKGGMVLAAYDARRPTADLDALARSVANDEAAVLSRVAEIARLAPSIDDGVVYRTETATARVRVASVIRLFGAARQRGGLQGTPRPRRGWRPGLLDLKNAGHIAVAPSCSVTCGSATRLTYQSG